MFFDDRLATVLRQSAASEAGARTQYRQLLDILGNRKFSGADDRSRSLISAGWARMDKLAEDIPAASRAAMIRETGWRFRSTELAAHLAEHEPEVASAALTRAQLSADDWLALIPRLPVRARGFLRLRRDLPVDIEALLEQLGVYDRGLPSPGVDEVSPVAQPAQFEEPASEPAPPSEPDPVSTSTPTPDPEESGRSEISALVERIAQFKRTRDPATADADRSPRLPLGEVSQPGDRRLRAFGFAADAGGRIEWAESDVAPMVIGTRLRRPAMLGDQAGETPLERSFARRVPIVQSPFALQGAEAIAGDWIVDAQPSFTDDGNFRGYVGRFRRPPQKDDANSPARREADRIRQLLHELRTPVTAVQGYAEVIQQQLFGPAPHEYRALAAAIAADAARVLSGFEELDRLAKLETGIIAMEEGEADFGALVLAITNQLGQVLSARMAGIDLADLPEEPVLVALDSEDAEGLLWRMLATLGGGCASGEMLEAAIRTRGPEATLTCELPAQLLSEDDVFAAEARPVGTSINAGLFGAGFALRLARAEAEAAGGTLVVEDDAVRLTLPIADASNSQSGRRASAPER